MDALPRSLTRALDAGGDGLSVLTLRLGAMGDILRTLPAVRILRRTLPLAKIRWVLDDKWRGVLEGHPDLDGVVPLPRRTIDGAKSSPTRWPELARAIGEFRSLLHSARPGLLLDFHGNLRSGLTAWLSGAAVRLGYDGHQQKEGNRLLTTHHVASGDRRTPRVERNLDLLRALGIGADDLPPLELPLVHSGAEAAREARDQAGVGDSSFAVLSPAASVSQAYKIPPAELFAAACDRLHEHRLVTLVVWGPGEEHLAQKVVAAAAPGAARLAPATTLPALAGLLGEARMFVGADSGPLHLACAAGCPVLGVYGPTDPSVNRPWGVPFRSVHPPGRRYTGIKRIDRRQAFEGLEPEQVAEATEALIVELEQNVTTTG